jgi:Glycosyltransferases involved in cell wall biogenesis
MDKNLFPYDLISVVIPVYNSEKYVISALDSLKNQTYKNFEAIIVDGSTDSTTELITEYIKTDSRFFLHKIQNNGPGFARNYGITKSSGVYVAFMDHDDVVHRDWLSALHRVIVENDVDIALCSGFYNIYSDNSVETFQTEVSCGLYVLNENLKKRLCHGWIAPWFKLMSLEFIKKHAIKFSLDNAFDDVLFHFMAIHYAEKIAFSDKILYYHRVHEKSVTNTASENGDMYFYHFKTVYDMLSSGCDADIIKLFLHFMKMYAAKVTSKEKYISLHEKIRSLVAHGEMNKAKDIAKLAVDHINFTTNMKLP